MKTCDNLECPFFATPGYPAEYHQEATNCSDCGRALAWAGREDEPARPELPFGEDSREPL